MALQLAEARELYLELKGCPFIDLPQPNVCKTVEPAWDAESVSRPTYVGLYHVVRATGKRARLARQTDTPMNSCVLHEGRAYITIPRGYVLPK